MRTRAPILTGLATIALLIGVAADGVRGAVDAITYHLEAVHGGARTLGNRFDGSQLEILQKLNRVDFDHLARLDYLVVPDLWVDDQLTYSPLPQTYIPAAQSPKLIVVSIPWQVFGGYENGVLVRWGPISSGRRTNQTPTGLFHLNWKSEGRYSTVDPEWFMRWYFNFGNAEGWSFHEYPLPGEPASHACVRLLESDARWMFEWGDTWRLDPSGRQVLTTGTPVLIVGRYDFDAPPPWSILDLLTRGIELPTDRN